ALGALTAAQWTVGQAGYPGAIPVSGGTGSFTLVAQSNLPPGLTAVLSGNSVLFTGTPTAAGTFASGTVTGHDATGATAMGAFTFTVSPAPTLGVLSPAQWTAGVAGYTGAIPVSGGTGPFTVVAQSNLPAGLSAAVTGTNVTFTGAPTTAGTF